ncbi:MAG TPA: hypothetical protein VGO93_09370 [Candidatus Xenobia bacterium]|jgi:hypothetical protein
MGRAERLSRWLVKELISIRTRFRGPSPAPDGRTTLLTVNYQAGASAARLARSFRWAFGEDAPVVVVENGVRAAEIAAVGRIAYVKPWANLHHALGLDYGMRHVKTEWTLVCDPDACIIHPDFKPRLHQLAQTKGVAGIDSGHAIYHPICLFFKTEWWKTGGFSFLHRWPWWDVAGELTHLVGGRDPATLLKRTRVAGPRFRDPIYLVEVYEDLFTNTYLGSRRHTVESDDHLGMPRDVVLPLHDQWAGWVSRVVDQRITVPFPLKEEILDPTHH